MEVAAPDVSECSVQYAMMVMVLPAYVCQGEQIHIQYVVQMDKIIKPS